MSGAIGPLVATSLALKYHWTYGFMIPGLLCMSVAYLAAILLRNKPSDIGLEDMDADDRARHLRGDQRLVGPDIGVIGRNVAAAGQPPGEARRKRDEGDHHDQDESP